MISLKFLLLLATCAGAEKLMNIEGKIALVTGGAQGIGYAIVEALLGAGIRGVTLVDLDITKGKTAAKALNSRFGNDRVIFLPADVSNESQFKGKELVYSIATAPALYSANASHANSIMGSILMDRSCLVEAFKISLQHWKAIDIVVNNAGIVNEKNWKATINTNSVGTLQGTFLGFRYMSKSTEGKGGVIINISSLSALGTEYYFLPVYSASKSFVLGLGRALGHQIYYDYNEVRIVTVCPGLTPTELVDNAKTLTSNALVPNLQDIASTSIANTPFQSLQSVGDGIRKVIEDGSHGSVWVIEDDELPYEIDFPDRKTMRKKDV